MLYRAEIIANREVLAAMNFPDNNSRTRVTHPQQAMRKVLDRLNESDTQQEFLTVHVLNEDGQLWTYQLRRQDSGEYKSTPPRKSRVLLPGHVRHEVFSGNTTIHEVMV